MEVEADQGARRGEGLAFGVGLYWVLVGRWGEVQERNQALEGVERERGQSWVVGGGSPGWLAELEGWIVGESPGYLGWGRGE